MDDIGRVLAVMRDRSGLSQRQVAEAVGVYKATIARWELSISTIPLDRYLMFCHVTGGDAALTVGVLMQQVERENEQMDEFDRKIGQSLIQARQACRLTQGVAGAAIGMSGSGVSYIENGRNAVSLKNFAKLCALYGLDPTTVLANAVGLNAAAGKKASGS